MDPKAPKTVLKGAADGGNVLNASWKRWGLPVKILVSCAFGVVLVAVLAWSVSTVANSIRSKKEGISVGTLVGQIGNNNSQVVVTPHTVVESKPWRLTDEQQKTLTARMKPYAGADDRHAWLRANSGNRDSTTMVLDIVSALRAAGWNMGSGPGFVAEVSWLVGVAVAVRGPKDDACGMSVFRQAMKDFGLDNDLYIRSDIHGPFEIHVGPKP